jgi:hypothetical protein
MFLPKESSDWFDNVVEWWNTEQQRAHEAKWTV